MAAMKPLILAALLCLAPLSATATPPEVLKPFKEYRAALEAGDEKAELRAARAAYEAAQKAELKPATRAAIAHNLAASLRQSDIERSVALYKEAIATEPDAAEINAQRHVAIGNLYIADADYALKNRRDMRRDIQAGLDHMEANGLVDTTFGAEMLTLRGVTAVMSRDRDEGLDYLDRALAIFDSDKHLYPSALRYHANVIKGQVLNADDRPIGAALALQVVMQNLEGELPVDHPFIETAFGEWMAARNTIGIRGQVDKAVEAGVCKCWPYDERSTQEPIPTKRVPPKMPRNARSSGHVMVRFDLDGAGKPTNITPLVTTDRMFVKPAVRAVEQWEYDVAELDDADARTGIVTKLTYMLSNGRGGIYGQPKRLIVLDEEGYAASKAARAE